MANSRTLGFFILIFCHARTSAILPTLQNMAPAALRDLLSALPSEPSWGPPTSQETTLDGVPYAPFSKADKLSRMADWTQEGKDRERGQRQQYQNRYRGMSQLLTCCLSLIVMQINRFTVPERPACSRFRTPKMSPPSPLSTIRVLLHVAVGSGEVAPKCFEAEARGATSRHKEVDAGGPSRD